jgi:hypothetical protein
MSTAVDGFTLSLRDAVERYKSGPGADANAYDWYRRGAQQGGRVSFGRARQLVPGVTTEVHVQKVGNKWMVNAGAFDAAIAELRASQTELEQITNDYDEHRLAVGPGQGARTTWGSYEVYEDFHAARNAYALTPDNGTGHWTCSRCWESATLEHNKPECHTCSDWGSCGRDCTLSRIVCIDCGTSMAA